MCFCNVTLNHMQSSEQYRCVVRKTNRGENVWD